MFKIQSSNANVTQHQIKKEIAGIDARTTLKSKMNAYLTQATDPWYKGRVDTQDAMKHYKDFKRNYENTCPETLDVATKNAMWKRAKQLKDEFVVGMLSQDELHPIKGINVDGAIQNVVDNEKIATNRTVERNTKWYNQNSSKLSEFKNIMRHLCPDDPVASDIERYRPKTRRV